MNQTFKSFQAATLQTVLNEILSFVAESNDNINPLSLGLTNKPEGGFLAILGFNNDYHTEISFKTAQCAGVHEDPALFDNHMNSDEHDVEDEFEVICHAVTFDSEGVLNIVWMLEA